MDASTLLDQYGLAGLIIAALSATCVVLYKDNKSLQDKLRDSQQARVDDAKEVGEKIILPIDTLGKTMELVYRKLYDAKKES